VQLYTPVTTIDLSCVPGILVFPSRKAVDCPIHCTALDVHREEAFFAQYGEDTPHRMLKILAENQRD